jgi:hypothetical protein
MTARRARSDDHDTATVLRIGVTGHRRPPKLPDEVVPALRATVGQVLDRIAAIGTEIARQRGAGNDGSFHCTVVSSLAEGADQIVAEEGLRRQAGLRVVLPFAPEEYMRDFAKPATQRQFSDLLARATAVTVLDFSRTAAAQAYEAAGHAMLAHSDLLIAIWDEADADGRGGTAHIVARARAQAVPVILITPETAEKAVVMNGGLTAEHKGSRSDQALVEAVARRLAAELGAQ